MSEQSTYEENSQKLYYSIKEVAESLEVNVSTIRFWEQQFETIKPRKNDKGSSFYTKEDIEEFKLIKHLKEEKGLRLDAIKQRIKMNKSSIKKNFEISESLLRIKKGLQEIKNELDDLHTEET